MMIPIPPPPGMGYPMYPPQINYMPMGMPMGRPPMGQMGPYQPMP